MFITPFYTVNTICLLFQAGGISYEDNIVANVDLKLIDVPEMGYFTNDDPPRGEICVKTLEVIDGYYKNPAETQDKFVDG